VASTFCAAVDNDIGQNLRGRRIILKKLLLDLRRAAVMAIF